MMDDAKKPPEVGNCEIYDNIPDGRYKARVAAAELRLSRAGNPMVVYEFVITSGFFAKRHVWKYAVLREGASARILEDARRLGIKADALDALRTLLPGAVGEAAQIALKTSVYRGKTTQFINIVDDGGPDE